LHQHKLCRLLTPYRLQAATAAIANAALYNFTNISAALRFGVAPEHGGAIAEQHV